MLTEYQIIGTLMEELRRAGALPANHRPSDPLMLALRRAARRISDDSRADCQAAARAASIVGAAVTRGRTRP